MSAPGTAGLKQSVNESTPLNKEEHAQYRRSVGKLQWLTYTRPDIAYATKELARDLQLPTQRSMSKLKHLLRYLRGTQHYKQTVRPTIAPQSIQAFKCLRRRRLGRMPEHKEFHKWIHNDTSRSNNSLRKPNTIGRGTFVSRVRTLRNRNSSTRSAARNEFHQRGNPRSKDQCEDTHGFNKWKEHRNKNRKQQESETR